VPHVEICDAERLCTDAALVLDASTRIAAAAGSGVLDARLHKHLRFFHFLGCFVGPSCYSSIQSLVNTGLLYTGAALVPCASTRDAATAQSGVLEHVHVHGVVEYILRCARIGAHTLSLARKWILRASRRDL